MLDHKGFDVWADGYDESVVVADEENLYPFAGYKEVLNEIFNIIMRKPKASVLDIGFGTGTLATALYRQGHVIYGQDFSEKMIRSASQKMPKAHLYQGDFSQGLLEPLLSNKYDFIVATYSLHHLTDEQKRSFIDTMFGLLKSDGKILIGDVAFNNREELEDCRLQAGDEWDFEEIYFVVDEWKTVYPKLVYESKSYCSGVLILAR